MFFYGFCTASLMRVAGIVFIVVGIVLLKLAAH